MPSPASETPDTDGDRPPAAGTGQELARREDVRRAVRALILTARREIALLSTALEPAVYDDAVLLEAIGALARRRGARVRVLIREPRTVVTRGHRLVELARRLSSSVELRRPHPEHRDGTEQILIADESGVLFRPDETRFEGRMAPNAPAEARRRLRTFEEWWALAEPDPELQRLHL